MISHHHHSLFHLSIFFSLSRQTSLFSQTIHPSLASTLRRPTTTIVLHPTHCRLLPLMAISSRSFSPSLTFSKTQTRFAVSSRLNSYKSSNVGGSISPENGGELPHELHHDLSPQRRRRESLVFVTLLVKSVGLEGKI